MKYSVQLGFRSETIMRYQGIRVTLLRKRESLRGSTAWVLVVRWSMYVRERAGVVVLAFCGRGGEEEGEGARRHLPSV